MPTLIAERRDVTGQRSQIAVPILARHHGAGSEDAKRIERVAEGIIRERWEELQSKPAMVRMLAEVKELLAEDNPESRPTHAALGRMRELLSIAGFVLQEEFPYGYVMDDGEQGGRVEWENRNAQAYVSLVTYAVPGKADYVYYQGPDDKVLRSLSPDNLISALAWFAAQ